MEANNKENETGLPMAKDSRPDGGITTEDRSVKPSSVAESKEEETIAEGLEEGATVETVDGSNVEATTAVTPPEATGNDSSAPPQAHKGKEDVTQEDPSTPTKIPQESMKSPKKEERKEAPLDLAALQRPLKRARTAYFIFAEDRRPELQKQHTGGGVTIIAKALGQLWATLPAEEKQVYQLRAAEERTRVQAELQARQAAGLLPEAPEAAAAMPQDPAALIFPLNRMRKICKLDPEVRGLSKEALALVTKAAELALAKLGTESVRVAQMQNRRKLLPEDVVMVCQTRSAFFFLKEDLADLVAATVPTTAATKKKTNLPSQANKLTSYFTAK